MLNISLPSFAMTLSAGEPLVFSFKPVSAAGVPDSLTGRRFAFAIYDASGKDAGQYEAEITTGSDAAALWRLNGSVSEKLRGSKVLLYEVCELIDEGRDPLFRGTLTVQDSAPMGSVIADYNNAPIARYLIKLTRSNDVDTIDKPNFKVTIASYAALTGSSPVLAPTFSVNPAISGNAVVGSVLTGSVGSSTGTASAMQWLRNGTAISGATALTYTLVSADESKAVSFRVTSTNSSGSVTATSTAVTIAAAPVVVTPAPVFSAAPSIWGTAQVGQTLTAQDGTASNASGYARQWLRNGSLISGATASSYTLVSADLNASITVRVTATSAGGSTVATSAAVTVAEAPVSTTPVAVIEAVMSPANTTLRSTYSMSKVGPLYSMTPSTTTGNGVYWPRNWFALPTPNPKYPNLKIGVATPDHGMGASGAYYFYINGEITDTNVVVRSHDDVMANTDWLSHLTDIPLTNPIYIGPQAASDTRQMETVCIIPFNGKLCFYFQMTGPFSVAYLNQSTVRAITTDGFHFTSDNIAQLQRGDGVGDGHCGYFEGGRNPFPGVIDPATGQMAIYAGVSLHGGQARSTTAIWATDNPETGTWRKVRTFGKVMGRNPLGTTGNWSSFAHINMSWSSIQKTRQGWSFITEAAARGSGSTARPGDLYEVCVKDDLMTFAAKPQLVLGRGASGTYDAGEVSKGDLVAIGDKYALVYEAASSSNVKIAALATSPRRNAENTWFEPLSPSIPSSYATKTIDFTTASALPSGFTAVTTGTPQVTYSSAGAAVTLAPNDKYYVFENAGFDPTQTDYVDIFLDDFISIAGGSTGSRIPYIGFATSKTARSAMTDAIYLTNTAGGGTLAYASLVAGTETKRTSDYVYGIGYVANSSGTSAARKHKGMRWFPKSNEAYVLEEFAEGEPMRSSAVNYAGLLDKTKLYYPFIAFESDGTTAITEQLGALRINVSETVVAGDTTAPVITSGSVGSTAENVAYATSLTANETVTWSKLTGADSALFSLNGSTLALTARDFETPGDADANNTYICNLRATDTAGNFTDFQHTVTVTDVVESAPVTPGTPATIQARYAAVSTSNASAYSFASVPLGSVATTRKIVVIASGRAAAAAVAPTAMFTPDGGSAITMSAIAMVKSNFDTGENTMIAFTASVPSGTAGTFAISVTGGWVRASIDSVCTVNAASTPIDTATAQVIRSSGVGSANAMNVALDKVANGVTFAAAQFSTSGSTFHSSALETPTSTVSDVAVGFTNTNEVPAWSNIANGDAGALLEVNGSAGGVMLALSFAPA